MLQRRKNAVFVIVNVSCEEQCRIKYYSKIADFGL